VREWRETPSLNRDYRYPQIKAALEDLGIERDGEERYLGR
jgi:hypothetical protein